MNRHILLQVASCSLMFFIDVRTYVCVYVRVCVCVCECERCMPFRTEIDDRVSTDDYVQVGVGPRV
jgi:hypothetical protein